MSYLIYLSNLRTLVLIYLLVYLSICLSVCLSASLSVSVQICLCLCLPMSIQVYLCLRSFFLLKVCLFVFIYDYLSIWFDLDVSFFDIAAIIPIIPFTHTHTYTSVANDRSYVTHFHTTSAYLTINIHISRNTIPVYSWRIQCIMPPAGPPWSCWH